MAYHIRLRKEAHFGSEGQEIIFWQEPHEYATSEHPKPQSDAHCLQTTFREGKISGERLICSVHPVAPLATKETWQNMAIIRSSALNMISSAEVTVAFRHLTKTIKVLCRKICKVLQASASATRKYCPETNSRCFMQVLQPDHLAHTTDQ